MGVSVGNAYKHDIFEPDRLVKRAREIAEYLAEWQIDTGERIEALAVRGSSGLGMGTPVSMLTGIPLIYVRKDGERNATHGTPIEGSAKRMLSTYMVFDDTIASGNTVKRIVEDIHERFPTLIPQGIFLFNHAEYNGAVTIGNRTLEVFPIPFPKAGVPYRAPW